MYYMNHTFLIFTQTVRVCICIFFLLTPYDFDVAIVAVIWSRNAISDLGLQYLVEGSILEVSNTLTWQQCS